MTAFADSDRGPGGWWSAGVEQDYRGPFSGVRFCLVQGCAPGHVNVVKSIDGSSGAILETTDESASVEHWLNIPDGAARALLDALSQHYGGTGDTRQVRRDLDAERARVDKLTDAVVSIATRTANGS